ncbi:MAG: hypothetical protein LBG06_03770 [Deltaproteobacteria bacterium]|jgi:hypothetical protein|nr:hypothetical protein [Deltaproteobacteria bacterium]
MTKNLPRGGFDKGDAPMAQVREILFGAQLKDMEMRFRRQEERFLREIAEVRDSLRGRLDSLENHLKSEVTAIFSRLAEEKSEREAQLKAEERDRKDQLATEARERDQQSEGLKRELYDALTRETKDRTDSDSRLQAGLQSTDETLERKTSKLSQALDTAERALRDLIKSECTSLNDKIDERHTEMVNHVAKTSAQIRSDMVYRTALSTMFTETVGSLSKPWNLDVEDEEEGSGDVYVGSEAQGQEGQGPEPQGQEGQGGEDQGSEGQGGDWGGERHQY